MVSIVTAAHRVVMIPAFITWHGALSLTTLALFVGQGVTAVQLRSQSVSMDSTLKVMQCNMLKDVDSVRLEVGCLRKDVDCVRKDVERVNQNVSQLRDDLTEFKKDMKELLRNKP